MGEFNSSHFHWHATKIYLFFSSLSGFDSFSWPVHLSYGVCRLCVRVQPKTLSSLLNAVWYDMLRPNFVSWEKGQISWGYITNSQHAKLPVGLIARLVEHFIGTVFADVMGWNPFQAWIFFSGFNFTAA